MKMAKATERDVEASLDIASIIGALENGYRPVLVFGEDDRGLWLDMDSTADLRAVVEKLIEIARRGSIFRVVFGMAVALDPKNEVFDPASDVLELHPKIQAARQDAERYRLLRRWRPGLLLDVMDDPPVPNEAWGRELDRECDARIQASPGTSTTSQGEALPDQP